MEATLVFRGIKVPKEVKGGDTIRRWTILAESNREFRCEADGIAGIYTVDTRVRRSAARRWRSCSSTTHSLVWGTETSAALRGGCQVGFGFRCGFMGMPYGVLQESRAREFNMTVITDRPFGVNQSVLTNGRVIEISAPSESGPDAHAM